MIAITLCTRGRPGMLARCLASLPAAIARIDDPVFVVVVENDAEPQARITVEGFSDRLDIVHVQEPEPGIPFARNRAVEVALDRGFDWLIFIDDDEWVAEDWLERFVAARKSYPEAEVLMGPVLRDYPENAPGWLPKSGQSGLATGTELPSAATNNTMAAARLFRTDGLGLRFEERMRYTGGSDTELFLRVTDRGGKIVWVDEAQVFEEYPENRATLRWNLRRNIRQGSAGVLIERLHGRSRFAYALPRIGHCLYLGLGRMVQGVILMIRDRRRGQGQVMKGVLSLASAWGYLRGLCNLESDPYRKVDGH